MKKSALQHIPTINSAICFTIFFIYLPLIPTFSGVDKFVTSFDLKTSGGDQLRETEVIFLIIRFSLVSNPFCHVESQPVRTLSLLNVTCTSLQPESFCDLRTAARSRLSSSYSRRMKYLWVGNGRGAIKGERGGIPRVFQLIYLEIFITLAITSQTFRRLDVKR